VPRITVFIHDAIALEARSYYSVARNIASDYAEIVVMWVSREKAKAQAQYHNQVSAWWRFESIIK
jgi:hypothetical protein|tara:strand:- start:796 stop:990 length:195 start_codon:yes stop_codon:yes gene_type:complete